MIVQGSTHICDVIEEELVFLKSYMIIWTVQLSNEHASSEFASNDGSLSADRYIIASFNASQ